MLRPGLRVTVKLSNKPVPTGDFGARYDYTFHYAGKRAVLPYLMTWEESMYGPPEPCAFLAVAFDIARGHEEWIYNRGYPRSLVEKVLGPTTERGLRKLLGDQYDAVVWYSARWPFPKRDSAVAWCRGMREL